MENVNLNTEMHGHFTYCIVILYITFQIEYCYPYAFFISFDCIFDWINAALVSRRDLIIARFDYDIKATSLLKWS